MAYWSNRSVDSSWFSRCETSGESIASPVLNVDRGGRPISWIGWQAAANLICRDAVAWSTGEVVYVARGGRCRVSGEQTRLSIPAILASDAVHQLIRNSPPLVNANLFARDRHTCMYCGTSGQGVVLTRDHVVPRVQDGRDVWENVVTACRACNGRKGGRTPEQANMPLLAIPFRPSWAEYLMLANRRIVADQMEFLRAFAPKRRESIKQ